MKLKKKRQQQKLLSRERQQQQQQQVQGQEQQQQQQHDVNSDNIPGLAIASDQYYAVDDDHGSSPLDTIGIGSNVDNKTSTSSDVQLNIILDNGDMMGDVSGSGDGAHDGHGQFSQQQQEQNQHGISFCKHSSPRSCQEHLVQFCRKESLLVEVVLSILLAYIYPELGAVYLFPTVTAHWICVMIIFFLSGFALRIHELSNAALNHKFNIFVIVYNFLGISLVVNIVANFFYQNEIVSEDLMKGMIICSCLSMPTNMMVVLVMSANGDEAASLFLATTMNLMGIFVTPLLIWFYLGEAAEIDFWSTYRSVSLRVLLPIIVGLSMRLGLSGADAFVSENKVLFSKIRERSLVFVVYATFCVMFYSPMEESSGAQILVMALSQVILLLSAMIIAWILLFIFFNREPRLRVTGLFGCSTKTAALGIPLISAIYRDHPKLGIFTLPLLIWYPAQLVIGTSLASRLRRFVEYKLHKYEMESQMKHMETRDCDICDLS